VISSGPDRLRRRRSGPVRSGRDCITAGDPACHGPVDRPRRRSPSSTVMARSPIFIWSTTPSRYAPASRLRWATGPGAAIRGTPTRSARGSRSAGLRAGGREQLAAAVGAHQVGGADEPGAGLRARRPGRRTSLPSRAPKPVGRGGHATLPTRCARRFEVIDRGRARDRAGLDRRMSGGDAPAR